MNDEQKQTAEALHAEMAKVLDGPSKHPIVLEIMAELSANILTIAHDEKSPSAQGLFFAIGMAANALATAVSTDDIPVADSKRAALEIIAFAMAKTVVMRKVELPAEAVFRKARPEDFH